MDIVSDVSVSHGCSKTERKINFSQFKKALELCAEKKYGSKDDVGKFIEKICAGKGPATSGATVSCLNVTYWVFCMCKKFMFVTVCACN